MKKGKLSSRRVSQRNIKCIRFKATAKTLHAQINGLKPTNLKRDLNKVSFFTYSSKTNSNKRTHEEMLRGESNNTEIIPKKLNRYYDL